MSMTQRYSITALFKTADEIIHAAEETARAGYTRFDVHTPYPVHGMDRAMRLKPSKLGFFALAFGLLGAVGGVGFMTWVTLVDYPLVIGGKPFWSWPAFVPVAFEITVLLASVLSVVSMIILFTAGLKIRYFLAGFVFLAPVLYGFIKLNPEKMNRILAFLNPEQYVNTYSFQAIQSVRVNLRSKR